MGGDYPILGITILVKGDSFIGTRLVCGATDVRKNMAMIFYLRTKTQSPNSAVLLKESIFDKIYGHCVLGETVDVLSLGNIVGKFQAGANDEKLIELDF